MNTEARREALTDHDLEPVAGGTSCQAAEQQANALYVLADMCSALGLNGIANHLYAQENRGIAHACR